MADIGKPLKRVRTIPLEEEAKPGMEPKIAPPPVKEPTKTEPVKEPAHG